MKIISVPLYSVAQFFFLLNDHLLFDVSLKIDINYCVRLKSFEADVTSSEVIKISCQTSQAPVVIREGEPARVKYKN
jgi:hypothetical protein